MVGFVIVSSVEVGSAEGSVESGWVASEGDIADIVEDATSAIASTMAVANPSSLGL